MLLLAGTPLSAQTVTKKAPAKRADGAAPAPGRADFSSLHFLLHTDLDAKESAELLKRLETMLSLISTYWGRPQAGVVELYVVKDLEKWPAGSLPPAGRAKIASDAGVTVTETLRMSDKSISKSVVYAIADHGTPQHEAVHAYCGQTFGNTGPIWYAEGMAEMGQYWRKGDASVHCRGPVIEYLRSTTPKSIASIVEAGQFTGDSWENYAWRWALCHLLANNSNYRDRFRPMGLAFLAGQPVTFEDTYSAMADEINFEYRLFLANLAEGYRVDLCSWDWKHKFKPLAGSSAITSHVSAGRGWQPSGVIVKAGQKIDYSASGNWRSGKEGPDLTADGATDGNGRLVGTLFKDFELSEPFLLGSYGTLTAPGDGKLFFRCQEPWTELADSKGSLTVKFKLNGQGKPLDRPKEKKEKK